MVAWQLSGASSQAFCTFCKCILHHPRSSLTVWLQCYASCKFVDLACRSSCSELDRRCTLRQHRFTNFYDVFERDLITSLVSCHCTYSNAMYVYLYSFMGSVSRLECALIAHFILKLQELTSDASGVKLSQPSCVRSQQPCSQQSNLWFASNTLGIQVQHSVKMIL